MKPQNSPLHRKPSISPPSRYGTPEGDYRPVSPIDELPNQHPPTPRGRAITQPPPEHQIRRRPLPMQSQFDQDNNPFQNPPPPSTQPTASESAHAARSRRRPPSPRIRSQAGHDEQLARGVARRRPNREDRRRDRGEPASDDDRRDVGHSGRLHSREQKVSPPRDSRRTVRFEPETETDTDVLTTGYGSSSRATEAVDYDPYNYQRGMQHQQPPPRNPPRRVSDIPIPESLRPGRPKYYNRPEDEHDYQYRQHAVNSPPPTRSEATGTTRTETNITFSEDDMDYQTSYTKEEKERDFYRRQNPRDPMQGTRRSGNIDSDITPVSGYHRRENLPNNNDNDNNTSNPQSTLTAPSQVAPTTISASTTPSTTKSKSTSLVSRIAKHLSSKDHSYHVRYQDLQIICPQNVRRVILTSYEKYVERCREVGCEPNAKEWFEGERVKVMKDYETVDAFYEGY